MMTEDKRWLRRASAIYHHLQTAQPAQSTVAWPSAAWQRCELLSRRLRRASERGWHLTAARLQRELRELLRRLAAEFTAIERQIEPHLHDRPTASVRDIHADLKALQQEFDEVSVDRRQGTISVTTEPIELEGVYLGAFEIRLELNTPTPNHAHTYRVVAADPHPAAANESVTHPHVQDETVCEGDGRGPIAQALTQGRLFDFFVIVANLLRTYNAGSPYVSLEDWHGVECADCGSMMTADDRWTCEKCQTSICDGCSIRCPACDDVCCGECVSGCSGCDEHHCDACLDSCSQCDANVCPGCLDENERCPDCPNPETETHDDELAAGEHNRGTDAPVQSDRLGETAVPA